MPAAKFNNDQEREQAKAWRSLARQFERAGVPSDEAPWLVLALAHAARAMQDAEVNKRAPAPARR
jgi:hypothetical protein